MLGRDLFVSPETAEGALEHEAALPPGRWRDAWTGDRVDGAAIVRSAAPLERTPVWVRDDAWERLGPVFG
jgi:alpha-D-xyloside xylohydrolase